MEQTNRHHLAFPKRHYKTRLERSFRQHPLMIVRMNVDGHKDLHSTLQPPLKLRHHEMIGALGLLQEIRGENFKPEENIILLAEQLERGSDRSKKVATNLYLQAGFIAIHKA